jgi:hypothetical protein
MATYKATIQFDAPDLNNRDEIYSTIFDQLFAAHFTEIDIIGLEKTSLSAEEAIKQIKELKKDCPSILPIYWDEKLTKILDSVD